MSKVIQPIFEDEPRRADHTISLNKITGKLLENWLLFVVCVAVSMMVAIVYLRYSTPVYLAGAKVLVNDGKGASMENQLYKDLGVTSGVSKVDNEIEILTSKMLMRKVVQRLHLNIHYLVPGRVKTSELYDGIPYKIIPLFNDSLIKTSYSYAVTVDNGQFEFKSGDQSWHAKVGDTLNLPLGKVLIVGNNDVRDEYRNLKEFTIAITPVDPATSQFRSALVVEFVNKQVTILRILVKDVIPKRAEDVINTLIDVYLQANVDDKNRIVNGTMGFIDERLAIVSQELSGIEQDIETFKKTNELMDISEQGKMLLADTKKNESEILQKEVQLKVLESLEKFLQNQNNKTQIIPSGLLTQEPTLTAAITAYNALQSERQRAMLSYTENSPVIQNIDDQLRTQRSSIMNGLISSERSLTISLNALSKYAGHVNSEIKQVPGKERMFLEYSRQQNIKQELYLFLLTKREETAISKSATISTGRVIDVAETSGPVSPNRRRILLSAFVIGLVIPSLRILLKELFNTRVADKEEVIRKTGMPVLGEVGRSNSQKAIVIDKTTRTQISEQFRILRTNMQFLLTDEKEKVVMVTSSMSGEGKSFIATNLATTLALSGKKVVLLELDLRKPKISENIGIDNSKGFSNYVIGKASLNEIIIDSGLLDNFYIIPSGTIPPNPSELIMLPAVGDLFKALRERFDYVVVDTAPVGLVTDAQLLSSYADAVLFVVRESYTFKEQLKALYLLYHSNKMPNASIVINDVRGKGKHGYYGYHGYSYGTDYFEDKKNGVGKVMKQIHKKFNRQ